MNAAHVHSVSSIAFTSKACADITAIFTKSLSQSSLKSQLTCLGHVTSKGIAPGRTEHKICSRSPTLEPTLTLEIPTTGLREFIADLAKRHGVAYVMDGNAALGSSLRGCLMMR